MISKHTTVIAVLLFRIPCLIPFEVDANKSIQPLRAISCKNDLSKYKLMD